MDYIIGIDPGLRGAVVGLEKDGTLASFCDTPHYTVKVGKKDRLEHDPSCMVTIFEQYSRRSIHVFIEKVHSMPHDGVKQAFSLGRGLGLWQGILHALSIPYTFVTPQAWKKSFMEGKSDKEETRLRALELFPHFSSIINKKSDPYHGRSDALLIAEFGRRSLIRS